VARRIRLVGFDVDGVLTDGGLYLGGDGAGAPVELKRYDIQDGLGIRFLRIAGLHLTIITGRVSESVRIRARELEIEHVVQDVHARKLSALMRLLEQLGMTPEECAFVGDDFPDVPVLRAVGMAVAVGNAVPEVRDLCHVRLTKSGGHGAVREFAELLLKARGEWDKVVERYLKQRLEPQGEAAS
jgi:3-deoxy-D-manno-octulosonate 8-phosphate phosphatase (KDO 8-P phosphatase)